LSGVHARLLRCGRVPASSCRERARLKEHGSRQLPQGAPAVMRLIDCACHCQYSNRLEKMWRQT
jgi:hypothetical protein